MRRLVHGHAESFPTGRGRGGLRASDGSAAAPRAHGGRAQRHARRSVGCIAATAILLAGCGSTERTEQGDFPTGRFANIENPGHVFVFDAERDYYYFESD